MSIAQTQPARPGLWTSWAPALRMHAGFIAAELTILVAALALVAVVLARPEPLPGDVGLTLAWQQLVRPYALPTALIGGIGAINWPLPAGIAMAVIIAALALSRRWLDIAVALGTVIPAAGLTFLTRQWVARPRPEGYGVVVEQQGIHFLSFPSGHVEHAVAFLGLILFLTYQVRRPLLPWLAAALWLVRIVLLVQIVLMAPSRVLVGEHWPSDAVAGLLYGAFWLLAGIQAYRWAARRWPRLVPPNERREVPGAA